MKRVCPHCDGEGTIVNPSCSVWTAEDAAEDPDGLEAMLDGVYDVTCTRCRGLRVIEDSNEERENWASEVEDAHTRAMESGFFGDGQLYI